MRGCMYNRFNAYARKELRNLGGAGGNRPGIPYGCPGSRSSRSDYRAAKGDSGGFPSSGSKVRVPQGRH
jgi:hypothetical protein